MPFPGPVIWKAIKIHQTGRSLLREIHQLFGRIDHAVSLSRGNSVCFRLSLGVVIAENNVNLGDTLCSEVEGFNLLCSHADENFHQASIGLLLRERC